MATSGISKSTPVERARERLEQAVADMESAVQLQMASDGSRATSSARSLEEVRTENDSLRQINEIVSRRLDEAIERLKAVLEG